jgi:hypothetical protein
MYLLEVLPQSPRKNMLLLVLGCTMLTDVVDAIYCFAHQHLKEFQRNSKLCYVGHKVYIDRRDAKNVDYSLDIRRWMDQHPQLKLHDRYPGTFIFESRL